MREMLETEAVTKGCPMAMSSPLESVVQCLGSKCLAWEPCWTDVQTALINRFPNRPRPSMLYGRCLMIGGRR